MPNRPIIIPTKDLVWLTTPSCLHCNPRQVFRVFWARLYLRFMPKFRAPYTRHLHSDRSTRIRPQSSASPTAGSSPSATDGSISLPNCLLFWDKLNKSNYHLELSIENADLPVDDRLVNFLAKDLSSDGGQWDMAVNLLETCGLVPQPIYPRDYQHPSEVEAPRACSDSSRALFIAEGRSQRLAGIGSLERKEELMQEVYTIMSASLGVPPKPDATFTWEYYTEDGKYAKWEGTPQFYEAFTAIFVCSFIYAHGNSTPIAASRWRERCACGTSNVIVFF
ncbi:peptidase C1-like family-domain-containing protein [Suillus discolor]|uniref:Peptidase C1-like family-domain-containing protein n=1 Tax=Suillus discolor TaxID=1912936 RepID=A0A9P7FL23_9AGAM|nr:peptidase C1-like family-domain-containing protein [Suillus discolor]KAG2119533.1 peptidase C1-like family-domain-containing protein [Suillus discolor]